MGWMNRHGKGVTTNRENAIKWYSLAAEQNYLDAIGI